MIRHAIVMTLFLLALALASTCCMMTKGQVRDLQLQAHPELADVMRELEASRARDEQTRELIAGIVVKLSVMEDAHRDDVEYTIDVIRKRLDEILAKLPK